MEKIAELVTADAVKHVFSEEELKEQSTLLAQAVKNKTGVEADKKVAMSGFTNTIKKLEADINIYSSNYNNGYTYKDVPCELWLDYDTNTRVYVSKETKETVKHEPFYAGDYQRKMAFEVSSETQAQIDENNAVHEGLEPDEDGLYTDRYGNKTDIDPRILVEEFKEDAGGKVLDGIIAEKKANFLKAKKK